MTCKTHFRNIMSSAFFSAFRIFFSKNSPHGDILHVYFIQPESAAQAAPTKINNQRSATSIGSGDESDSRLSDHSEMQAPLNEDGQATVGSIQSGIPKRQTVIIEPEKLYREMEIIEKMENLGIVKDWNDKNSLKNLKSRNVDTLLISWPIRSKQKNRRLFPLAHYHNDKPDPHKPIFPGRLRLRSHKALSSFSLDKPS